MGNYVEWGSLLPLSRFDKVQRDKGTLAAQQQAPARQMTVVRKSP
jgi:hypothetical protein